MRSLHFVLLSVCLGGGWSGCVGHLALNEPEQTPAGASGTGKSDSPSTNCIDGCGDKTNPTAGADLGASPYLDAGSTSDLSNPPDLAPSCNTMIFSNMTETLAEHDPSTFGQTCLDCHDGATHPDALLGGRLVLLPKFDFAGRVVTLTGTGGEGSAQVQVPGSTGDIAVLTNSLGYFWWPRLVRINGGYGSGGSLQLEGTNNHPTFPTPAGVKLSTGEKRVMCEKALDGNCNSCHNDSIAPRIF